MKLSFRNGIVAAVPAVVNLGNLLQITATKATYTFSDGSAEYLVSSSGSFIIPAPLASTYVVCAELSKTTGLVSYVTHDGTIRVSSTAPSTTNDMWFDTNNLVLKRFHLTSWIPCYRVIIATVDSGIVTPSVVGTSQVGFNTFVKSGQLVHTSSGIARLSTGQLLTSESDLFVDSATVRSGRLETDTSFGTAYTNVGDFTVVKITSAGVETAFYDDAGRYLLGFVETGALANTELSYVIAGKITNASWNFPVGAYLWIDDNGYLTTTNKKNTAPLITERPPIAISLSATEVYFCQGFNSIVQPSNREPVATNFSFGTVKLNLAAADANNPLVVGDNDPRLFDARTPTPHQHPASSIAVISNGNNIQNDVQQSLASLDANKINTSGGQLTGPLLTNGLPLLDAEVASKIYVDTVANNLTTNVFVRKSGSAMDPNATLTLGRHPVTDLEAANKGYVDNTVATKFNRIGGRFDGAVYARSSAYDSGTNSYTFTAEELVSKSYVDAQDALNDTSTLQQTVNDHVTDLNLHVTPAQHIFLGGLSPTLLPTELNYCVGVISPIQTQLDSKISSDSPMFTGTPRAPTAVDGTSTDQVATTDFVQRAVLNLSSGNNTPFESDAGNIQMDGVAAAGTLLLAARGDHVHPTDTTRAPLDSPTFVGAPAAPTQSASDSSALIATTAFVHSVVPAFETDANVLRMDGTAYEGAADTVARADHTHPTDTTRAPVFSPEFTGTPLAPTALAGTNTTQIATTSFVQQSLNAFSLPFEDANANIVPNGIADAGGLNTIARADHVHPTDETRAAIDSPIFVGTPKAPTAIVGTNNDQIATTAFVHDSLDASVAGAPKFNTISDMVNASVPASNTYAYVYGYTSPNDGGHGWFMFSSTVETPDAGLTFSPTIGVGTWKRVNIPQYIDVRWYGASDIGDSTAAINSAIVAALSKKLPVIIPAGRYNVSGIVYLSATYAEQVSIKGAGSLSTRFVKLAGSSPTEPILSINSNSSAIFSTCSVTGITFDGNNNCDNAVVIVGNVREPFEDCVFTNAQTGALFEGGISLSVNACTFSACGVGAKIDKGIRNGAPPEDLFWPNLIRFDNCKIVDNTSWGCWIDNARKITFSHCDIEGNGTAGSSNAGGVYVGPNMGSENGAGDLSIGASFEDCWFENNKGVASLEFKYGRNSLSRCYFVYTPNVTTDIHVVGGTYTFQDCVSQTMGHPTVVEESTAGSTNWINNCAGFTVTIDSKKTRIGYGDVEQPRAEMHFGGVGGTLTSPSNTILPFTTNPVLSGGTFALGGYTCSYTGTYNISASVVALSVPAGEMVTIYASRNGTPYKLLGRGINHGGGPSDVYVTGSCTFDANANDILACSYEVTTSVSFNGTSTQTYCNISKL